MFYHFPWKNMTPFTMTHPSTMTRDHMPWRPWDPGFRSGPSFRSSWSAWSKRPPAAELKIRSAASGDDPDFNWLDVIKYTNHCIYIYTHIYIYTYIYIYILYIYHVYYNIQYQTPMKTNTKMTNMIHLDLECLYYLAAASWLEGFTGLSRLRMP